MFDLLDRYQLLIDITAKHSRNLLPYRPHYHRSSLLQLLSFSNVSPSHHLEEQLPLILFS